MALELIKENIECEQLLAENFCDTVVKAEYLIPDTHPDVEKILMLDARPSIVSKEVMQDKVYVEGQIEYNLLYMAREEEKLGIYKVSYTSKFSNYIEISGADHKMTCEAECYIEHMEKNIVNERKISIEGIIKLRCEVYRSYDFEFVKEVSGMDEMQLLRNPATIDKILGVVKEDIAANCQLQIPKDRPQLGTILMCDALIRKKEIKLFEGKVMLSAMVCFKLLYRGKDTREVAMLEENVVIDKEVEMDGATGTMHSMGDFRVDSLNVDIKEDDLGESRIIDVEAMVKAYAQVVYKEEIETIEDIYSPRAIMDMEKKNYQLNVLHGQNTSEVMVKGNLELESSAHRVMESIMSCGEVCIVDKKIVEDKVVVDGILKVAVMYRTEDEENNLSMTEDEMPFTASIDIPKTKIDMQCIAKIHLDSLETAIEANTIAVKAVVCAYAKVSYLTNKEFMVNILPVEGEVPKKKASITIYVVQCGDTLWKIAKRYYTTMDDIAKLNDIEDINCLKAGEKLIIPGRALL